MAQYMVKSSDGSMYGPADENSLMQWAQEGRINAQTIVQDQAGGQPMYAQSLPFLAQIWNPQAMAAQAPAPYAGTAGVPLQYAGPVMNPQAHQLQEFPVAVIVLLHFLTLGIFPMIYTLLQHGKLPKVRYDDPGGGKAVGFMFIPFFNIYWIFFVYGRLCTRLNEQRQQHGLPPDMPSGLFIATIICALITFVNYASFVPFVNYIPFLILWPIVFGITQSKINELVRVSRNVR